MYISIGFLQADLDGGKKVPWLKTLEIFRYMFLSSLLSHHLKSIQMMLSWSSQFCKKIAQLEIVNFNHNRSGSFERQPQCKTRNVLVFHILLLVYMLCTWKHNCVWICLITSHLSHKMTEHLCMNLGLPSKHIFLKEKIERQVFDLCRPPMLFLLRVKLSGLAQSIPN